MTLQEQIFVIGDELKFSQEGVILWCESHHGFYDSGRYQLWRWRVIGYQEHYFTNGDHALVLRRIDHPRNNLSAWKKPLECWHPKFFEKVGNRA